LHIIAQKQMVLCDALSIFDRVVSFVERFNTSSRYGECVDYETYINVTDLILENKIPDLLMSFNEIV
jgi:DNA polymerase-3 subunit gamma/tau